MGPEQYPTTSIQTVNSNEIDPSNLIIQSGENIGAISDNEHSEGVTINEDGSTGEIHKAVDGLPIIGAYAEKDFRNEAKIPYTPENNDVVDLTLEGLGHKEALRIMSDNAGLDAMATEVGRRAMNLPQMQYASRELRQMVGEQAAQNFRDEHERKQVEFREQHDSAAKELLGQSDQVAVYG